MNARVTSCITLLCALALMVQTANAALLYSASLKNGDYGAGFKVGTYDPGAPWNRSGSTGGDLTTLGIVDSAEGVTYTTNHDVINFSLGADGHNRTTFRTTGAVSVWFKADSTDFDNGQPFVDNYGFDRFRSGQGTFGTSMSRHAGADGKTNTPDDRVSLGWHTWHNNVWYQHIDVTDPAKLPDFDNWHHWGFSWGGPTNDFEVWVDGVLLASDNLPGAYYAWGSLGLGSAYNFALGEIHERRYGDSSPQGVTFADLEIWNEYRDFGGPSIIPEPSTFLVWSLLAALGIGLAAYRRKR